MNSFPKITSDAFCDFGQDVSPLQDPSRPSLAFSGTLKVDIGLLSFCAHHFIPELGLGFLIYVLTKCKVCNTKNAVCWLPQVP